MKTVLLVSAAVSPFLLEPVAPRASESPVAAVTAISPADDKAEAAANYQPPTVRLALEDFTDVEQASPDKLALDQDRQAAITPDQTLPGGQRRVFQTQRVRMTAQQLEKLQRSGNVAEIDPQTGERIIDTFRDYLPENWRSHAADGERIDSYGNPIVNHADGLPDW